MEHTVEEAVSFCQAGRIRLAYSDEATASGGPLLLFVHGLGQQLTAWPKTLVQRLLRKGYRIVRLDNRDVGLSSRLQGKPKTAWLYLLSTLGWTGRAPYTLDDMADDLCALIEHLRAGPVHVIGASMGGMICQIAASRQPHLVRSLTSIMSSSGDHRLPKARADVLRHIMSPPQPPTAAGALAHGVKSWQLIGSPSYPTARDVLEERVAHDLKRGHPEAGGTERQFAAILASGSRVPLLRHVQAPSLVIHGAADPLVPLEAGRHVYENTPGARLKVIEGMGHDFPEALCPTIADLIDEHVQASLCSATSAGERS